MSMYAGYAQRGAPAGGAGPSIPSGPSTPAGDATPPAIGPRRPVGRPRKTAPAGGGYLTQSAPQAATFNTPQGQRIAHQAHVGSSQPHPLSGAGVPVVPIGQTVHPYATSAYAARLRQAGPPKDGTETQLYLIPGPTNRMLLSVRSGVPSQIDWGLNKLVQSSYAFSEGIQFEQLPGLFDQLLSFPRRVARAWSGANEAQWSQEYFEIDEPPEVNCPPEGHIAHESEDWFTSERELSSYPPTSSSSKFTLPSFIPSQRSSHASLLRRALEAALVLRNLSMMPLNTRWLSQSNPQARQRLQEIVRVVSEVLRIARPRGMVPTGTDVHGNVLAHEEELLRDDGVSIANSSALELEGLVELKSYMLELFETVAPLVSLEHGAPPNFGVVLSTRQRIEGAAARAALAAQERRTESIRKHRRATKQRGLSEGDASKGSVAAPADSIFHSLLSLVHHSSDRNLVIASLRCLAALGGYSMRNRSIGFTEREWEVVEVDTLSKGSEEDDSAPVAYATKMHSPGLLHLTALLVPLLHLRRTDPHPSLRSMGTQLGHTALANLPANGIAPSVKLEGDTDIGEAALDLLSQLVQIEGNALRIGMVGANCDASSAAHASDPSQEQNSIAPAPSTALSSGASVDSVKTGFANAGSPLAPASLFSFLTLLLPFQRVAWLRTSQLSWNTSPLPTSLPSLQKHETAQRMQRQQRRRIQRRMLGYRDDEESFEERAMRKRLRVWEAVELEGLAEPERAIKWMKLVFALSPDAELTQMEFWQSYQDEFRSSHSQTELLMAGDLIKLIAQVFPGANALVVKPAPNAPQRFIIKGIDYDQREEHGPLECRWTFCDRPNCTSGPTLAAHIRAHVDACPPESLRCRWSGFHPCLYVVPEFDMPATNMGSMERRHFTEEERRDILYRHLLTHLQKRGLDVMGSSAEEMTQDGDGPSPKRVRIDPSTQGSVRPGTADRPGTLYYTVARTPMDPATSAPIGAASISSMILRTLARTASRVLDRAGLRPELPSSLDLVPEGSLLELDAAAHGARIRALANVLGSAPGASNDNDKFGFPALPQDDGSGAAKAAAAAAAASAALKNNPSETSDKVVQANDNIIRDIFGICMAAGDGALTAGTSLGTGSAAADEDAAIAAANAIMDGLLSLEGTMIATSGENDVLCPALNDALVELRPEGVRSVYMDP
ncbi:unnamed protein product [Tilletia controversa]|uniref:RFX-type winged-helix domain-containing protein n=3 Tax=Tilletia TaxID=13289 RepID=A0A8X7MU36_9BASI|nr:hypothetical protein CF336_g3977 [Tilletia laevis]KAE8202031.1 hypothetical protein CF328_g2449 [Tilletia controversa]KAE8260785.1 hypothetical protein A4X03_0g3698 [Tilletia caries]KAE8201324.1 hypothetical protein CF335_g3767 [Tilletia laevis]KAE8248544.1 hypothetical protein A4X06_0g3631 [Tilletia controversa]